MHAKVVQTTPFWRIVLRAVKCVCCVSWYGAIYPSLIGPLTAVIHYNTHIYINAVALIRITVKL